MVHYKVLRGETKWVGLARLEPFPEEERTLAQLLLLPGDLWFAFGENPQEALWNITDIMVYEKLERNVVFCSPETF